MPCRFVDAVIVGHIAAQLAGGAGDAAMMRLHYLPRLVAWAGAVHIRSCRSDRQLAGSVLPDWLYHTCLRLYQPCALHHTLAAFSVRRSFAASIPTRRACSGRVSGGSKVLSALPLEHATFTSVLHCIVTVPSPAHALPLFSLYAQTNAALSSGRRKRAVPEGTASVEQLGSYTLTGSFPLHKTTQPGITALALHPTQVWLAGDCASSSILICFIKSNRKTAAGQQQLEEQPERSRATFVIVTGLSHTSRGITALALCPTQVTLAGRVVEVL